MVTAHEAHHPDIHPRRRPVSLALAVAATLPGAACQVRSLHVDVSILALITVLPEYAAGLASAVKGGA